jgi:hypothetical protein
MKHVFRFPCLFVLLLHIVLTPAHSQNQVTLGAIKDNTLYESSTGALSNGAGQRFFAGRSNQLTGSIRRGLLAFDIAGSIPAGAVIQSVTLRLYMSQMPFGGGGAETIGLNRVLVDWGEGTSVALGNEGGGAAATTGDATWLHSFFNTSFWSSPGGAFSPTPSASQSVTDTGFYIWGSTSAMVADVQKWLDTPSASFGWMVIGNEAATQTAKRFDGRQHLTPSVRPQLTVTFQPPVGVGETPGKPTVSLLHQNYPNPFNPRTTIQYETPFPGEVRLTIWNLLGQRLRTLVDQRQEAGHTTVEWDGKDERGRDVSTGIYLYRLEAGTFTAVQRMVLIR